MTIGVMAIWESTETEPTSHWSPSQLTHDRPDIWIRALKLAGDTTGIRYVEKLPLPDGTVYACGGGSTYQRPQKEKRDELAREIIGQEDALEIVLENPYEYSPKNIDDRRESIKGLKEELERLKKGILPDAPDAQALSVFIPSGAMEWLLHEVGHWVVASDADRKRPNYGNSRDIEAWAFEEAVLAHLGPARDFAPPTQRDGPAFTAGPLPDWAFRRVDKRLADGGMAIEPFQILWADWVAWGYAQGNDAPWR